MDHKKFVKYFFEVELIETQFYPKTELDYQRKNEFLKVKNDVDSKLRGWKVDYRAFYEFAKMYRDGYGCKKNEALMIYYYMLDVEESLERKLPCRSFMNSAVKVGDAFYFGRYGVYQNYQEAYNYYSYYLIGLEQKQAKEGGREEKIAFAKERLRKIEATGKIVKPVVKKTTKPKPISLPPVDVSALMYDIKEKIDKEIKRDAGGYVIVHISYTVEYCRLDSNGRYVADNIIFTIEPNNDFDSKYNFKQIARNAGYRFNQLERVERAMENAGIDTDYIGSFDCNDKTYPKSVRDAISSMKYQTYQASSSDQRNTLLVCKKIFKDTVRKCFRETIPANRKLTINVRPGLFKPKQDVLILGGYKFKWKFPDNYSY